MHITYLYDANGQKTYLSCVKDGRTDEILAHYLSTSLELDIVYQILERLKEAIQNDFHPEVILHSDQGLIILTLSFKQR